MTIHSGECVPAPEFNARATELSAEYAADSNFEAQWGLHAINAHLAYGHVNLLEGPDAAPGAGVTIGVIDTGIDDEHPIFEGKTIHKQFLFGVEQETGEEFSHGTAVASIAAGAQIDNPNAPHGVAWGADLAVWAIPLGTPDNVYDPITLEELAEADAGWVELFQPVFDWRDAGNQLDILNLSFGYEGLINQYAEEDLRANFPQAIAVLAQEGAAEKTILVWAAGNQNGDRCGAGVPNCVDGQIEAVSVGILPGLLAYMEELQGHSIAVVALHPDGGAIADLLEPLRDRRRSLHRRAGGRRGRRLLRARVGRARDPALPPRRRDLVRRAHGQRRAGDHEAALRDQLANEELVSRLFLTADSTGIYADRDVYGNGRMDLGAATSPVGVLDVPITTGIATAAHASLASTGLRMGAAFGDGLAAAFDGDELMALDDFGAPVLVRTGQLRGDHRRPRDVRAAADVPGARDRARGGGRRRSGAHGHGGLGARCSGCPPRPGTGTSRSPRARWR